MKKTLKIVGALALILLLIVGGVAFYVFHNIDSYAKSAVERGGTHAMGVTTKVDSVSVNLFGGGLSISDLDIANPGGYSTPHFLTLDSGKLHVSLGSLREDVIVVPELHLKGIDVNLEKNSAGANYRAIMDNLAKLKGRPHPSQPGAKEKRLIIKDLRIDKVNIHVDLLGAPGGIGKALNQAAKINIPIEHVELKDVGRTGTGVHGTGVTPSELSSIVVQAVLAAAAEKGEGLIPGDILGDIKGRLGSLGDLAGIPVAVVGKAGETLKQLGAQATEQVQKGLQDVSKTIEKGLENLIPGIKPEPKPEPKK